MCAGAAPAGLLPAGECPDHPSGGTRPIAPTAMLFTGGTHPRNSEGRYVTTHPVDAKVQLAMGLARKRLSSTPDVGNDLRTILHVGGNRTDAQIRAMVKAALKPIVDAREIEINNIIVTHPTSSANLVQLDYTNLVTRQRSIL